MSTIATLTTRFVGDTSGFDTAIRKIRSSMATTDGVMGKFEVGTQAAAVAVGAALIKTGTDFQQATNTIRRETGATGSQLDNLNQSLKNVYATRPESLEQVAQTIAHISRQSGATGPVLENLSRTTLRLASITKEDLNGVLQSSQQLMNNWGIAAENQVPALDVLYRTHQKTGISVSQLAETMSSQGVILRQLGLSYEDSAAMIGLLDKAGVSASQMQMGFNRVIAEAAKAGVPARDMFAQLFDRIRNAPSDTEAAGAAVDVFGARAGPRLAGLIREGRLSFDELSASIAGGSDTIDQAAADTATGTGRMKIAWHALQVAVEPIATLLINAFTQVAGSVMRLAQAAGPVFPVFVTGLLAAGAALKLVNASPVTLALMALVTVFSLLEPLLGPIPAAIIAIGVGLGVFAVATWGATAAATAFAVVMAVVTSPITLVVLAIAALVAGIVLLVTNWDTAWAAIRSAFEAAWNAIKVGLDAMLGFFAGLGQAILDAVTSLPGLLLDAGRALINGLWDGAKLAWELFIDWVLLMPVRILAAVALAAIWLIATGKDIITGAYNGVVAAWPVVRDWFIALPGRILDLVVTAAQWLWETGRALLTGMWRGIVTGAESTWEFLRALPGRILSFVTGLPSLLWNAGWSLLKGMANGIASGAEAIWAFFRDLPGRIQSAVSDIWNWLWQAGRDLIEGFINGIGSLAGKVTDKIKDIVKSPISAAKDLLDSFSPSGVFIEIGQSIGEGLVIGIESMAGQVAQAATGLAEAAIPAMPGVVAGPAVAAAAPVTAPAVAAVELPVPDTTAVQGAYTDAAAATDTYDQALAQTASQQAATLAAMSAATAAFTAGELNTWNGLSSGVQATVAALDAWLRALWTALAAFIGTTTTAMSTQTMATLNAWNAQLRALLTALDAWWRQLWLTLAQYLQTLTQTLATQLITTYTNLSARLREITTLLHEFLRLSWNTNATQVRQTVYDMVQAIITNWGRMRDEVGRITADMLQKFRESMTAMVKAGSDGAFNTSFQMQYHLRGAGPPITDIVRGFARSLRDALNPILGGIGKEQIRLPFAYGGRVPGAGDTDKVPAMLTPGEYVIPKRAVQRLERFDPTFLDQLRRGWLPLTSQPPRGYQAGGQVQPQVVAFANHIISKFPGIRATSWYRPGGTSYHGRGQAVDLASGMGPGNPMGHASRYIIESGMFRQLAEGIYNGLGANVDLSVKNGGQVPPGFWGAGTWAGHANHIHAALTGATFEGGAYLIAEAVELPETPKLEGKGDMYGRTAREFAEYVRHLAQQWVNENTMMLSDDMGPPGAIPAGNVREWISQALQIGNWPASWAGALYARAMQESSGNPRAVNNWDINAKRGTPSKGLMQTIDPTFNAYKLPGYGDIWNPVHNLLAAIRYMIARYGSPLNLPRGGYAHGGIFQAQAGGTIARIAEGGRDEAVIPLPKGWRRMMSDTGRNEPLSPAGARGGPAVHIDTFQATERADIDLLFATARFQQRAGRI